MATTMRLSDGRVLGFAEQGDTAGRPVLFFHGINGSRLLRHPDDSIARRLGLRIFTFDRPGLGLSTPKPRRRILDWPIDVAEFADAQNIERFAILGWSGGGPYALATGFRLDDRVSKVGLVAPMAPLAGTGLMRELSPDLRRRARVARIAPGFLRIAVASDRRAFRRDPAGFLAREFAKGPECDRAALDRPGFKQMLILSRYESYRQGARGLATDAMLYLRPWGFEPSKVRTPIRRWVGEHDQTLLPAMARYFEQELPGSTATVVAGEGHMLCLTCWEQVLKELTS
jgi:pimeloyl-ACP methyl ester carboxylesterase